MAIVKNSTGFWGFWRELLTVRLYKRNQGRLARQLTALGMGLILAFGAYTLSQGPLDGLSKPISVGIPLAILAVGGWIIFRVVHYPRFADFLISVEAEIDKVSWASKQELYRATIVVVSTMVVLGIVLLAYDLFWTWFFQLIGFLRV